MYLLPLQGTLQRPHSRLTDHTRRTDLTPRPDHTRRTEDTRLLDPVSINRQLNK